MDIDGKSILGILGVLCIDGKSILGVLSIDGIDRGEVAVTMNFLSV